MSEQDMTLAPVVTADQVDLIKRTVAAGATDDELKLHLYNCQRRGIHPLDGLLHFTKRGGKYVPVASIDLMRTRAAETGEYAGNDDPVFHGTFGEADFAATVTVWRLVQGQRYPFSATARWAEYYPGDQAGHMWRKMPHVMVGKVAEALALRKAFPQTLSGLYDSAELDQADTAAPPPLAPSASEPRERTTVSTANGEPPLLVLKVEPRAVAKKDGTEGTVYRVHFSDGIFADTWSESLAEDATQAKDDRAPVERTVEEPANPRHVRKLKALAFLPF